MSDILLYPITVKRKEEQWFYHSSQFPEIKGSSSDLESLYLTAKEQLEKNLYQLLLNRKSDVPVSWEKGHEKVVIIAVSAGEILQKYGSTPVKKMVSIPSWLSYQAEKEGLSLSKVLQEALKEKLKRTEE
ncbi:hypothetical protein HCB45_06380 [Listeria sp. FSL L7-0091]|uniref:hypothetical protein n=1 Tax=Listeria farberi TaxID=2713500 RepID=UPI001625517F|nr:hypothetical protein [Listeria farberi]MBC2261220.1 hypothetical protein [Listeria farberi]